MAGRSQQAQVQQPVSAINVAPRRRRRRTKSQMASAAQLGPKQTTRIHRSALAAQDLIVFNWLKPGVTAASVAHAIGLRYGEV